MTKSIRLLTLITASLFVLPVHSETLMEIYQRSLGSDPSLREADALRRATLQSKPQAIANLLPQIDSSAAWNNTEQDGVSTQFAADPISGATGFFNVPSESDVDTLSWSLDLRQTIFRWDQFALLAQASKEVARAEADYRAAEQDLMIRVADAYFNVLAAEDTLTSEQAAKEAISRQLEQAQRRFEVGLIAITDVQEAQAGYDTAVSVEILAKRNLATAKEQLREVTGDYPVTLAKPIDAMPLIGPDPANNDQWVDTALQRNLSLVSAQIGADIARDNVRLARSGHYPTLEIVASYGNSQRDGDTTTSDIFTGVPTSRPVDTDQDTTRIGVQFTLPIFSGGGVHADARQAVYLHRAAKENLERVARQVERETRDAYLGVDSEIARVKALRQARKSSQTALEATEAGFEVGTRTTVDVLDARRQLFITETNYARSRYDYIVNWLRLKQAAGNLTVSDLTTVNSWLQQ
jgi:outer membrane protein